MKKKEGCFSVLLRTLNAGMNFLEAKKE